MAAGAAGLKLQKSTQPLVPFPGPPHWMLPTVSLAAVPSSHTREQQQYPLYGHEGHYASRGLVRCLATTPPPSRPTDVIRFSQGSTAFPASMLWHLPSLLSRTRCNDPQGNPPFLVIDSLVLHSLLAFKMQVPLLTQSKLCPLKKQQEKVRPKFRF